MKRALLVLTLAFATYKCRPERPPSSPNAAHTPMVSYSMWSEPASFDQLLRVENDPDSTSVPALIDELLAEALAGVPADAAAKTQMLHLIWYIHTHLASENPVPAYTTRLALEQRTAACGGSALILQYAARRLGFTTRGVGFFGVPLQAAHTGAEVYWDNAWHYLDPSFGAFFTDDGTLDGDILDAETLIHNRAYVAENAFYPIADGRLGRSYSSPKPASLAAMFAKQQTDLPLSGDYALFLPHTVAATPYSLGEPLETAYAVDLSAGRYAIGAFDGTANDISLHVGSNGYYDGASLGFVGDMSSSHGILHSHLSFLVSGVAPGRFITWEARVLTENADLVKVSVRKANVVSLERTDTLIRLVVEALREDVEISLTAPQTYRVIFDAHTFSAN